MHCSELPFVLSQGRDAEFVLAEPSNGFVDQGLGGGINGRHELTYAPGAIQRVASI